MSEYPAFSFSESSTRRRLARGTALAPTGAAMAKVPADTRDTRQRADRERRLSDHMASATLSLRAERDRLAKRLADLERQLANLAARLDSPSAFVTPAIPDSPDPDRLSPPCQAHEREHHLQPELQ